MGAKRWCSARSQCVRPTCRARGADFTLSALQALDTLRPGRACVALYPLQALRASGANETLLALRTGGAGGSCNTLIALRPSGACNTLLTLNPGGAGGANDALLTLRACRACGAKHPLLTGGARRANNLADVIELNAIPDVQVAISLHDIGIVDLIARGWKFGCSGDRSFNRDANPGDTLCARGASRARYG